MGNLRIVSQGEVTVNIGAISRMLDMARAQQILDECSACDAEPSQGKRDELKRQSELDAVGADDNKRQIQY
ncbi:hypothetical protein [Pseudomonas sp. MWU13-2517]|uniref:hypothetical protein n=1 Tax=Pseudomonas sp. MWU13-2517 TaxID=2929055 RepID=UPI00200C0D54|nr:hypothetical protein [Pseudomonas sp. MWU13-2517]